MHTNVTGRHADASGNGDRHLFETTKKEPVPISKPVPNFRRAFTLIELLLVLVILAILASLVVPRFTGQTEKARIIGTQTQLSTIEGALDRFEMNCGRFPSTEEGIRSLVENPGNLKGWDGPYLKKGLPVDSWDNPFNYCYPGQQHPGSYDLWSNGPDKQSGTSDDIDYWSQKSDK